jgi:hypothetical protein
MNNFVAENVSGVVAVENGGTGSSTQNFVDLTTEQNIDGNKTFNSNATFNGMTSFNGLVNGNLWMLDLNFGGYWGRLRHDGFIFDLSSHIFRYDGMFADFNSDLRVNGFADFNQDIHVTNSVFSNSFIKNNGLSSEFLKADGSVDTNSYVTAADISSSFLPLSGGTLTGQLFTPSIVFNNSSIWEIGNSGSDFRINQGGCCSRLTMDSNGNLGIGANYSPSYKLDIEGTGRFTQSVISTSFITPGGTSSQFLKADGSIDYNNYFVANTSNVAIGYVAGSGGQGEHSIAIGGNAAQTAQAEGGVAIGFAAGQNNQGVNAIAIGTFAGQGNQAVNSIAIGYNSNSSGTNSVAIGKEASVTTDNTIQLGNSEITDVKTSGSITAKSITSSGRMVMSTATIESFELNNYDVSNVSILFVRPDSEYTNIYGLTGGVVGQVIHIYSVNNQTGNCCSGLSLWNYDSSNNSGIQKFVAPGGYNIQSDNSTTLVFDGTYWRVMKVGGNSPY